MSRVVKPSKSPSSARRKLRMSPLVALLALGACTSVLGIEDLHEGPRDGENGGTDNTTSGKNANGAGKTNNGAGAENNAGGVPDTGGKNGSGGKTNNGGAGNVGADGGVGNAGADGGAPAGGADNTPGSTVDGKVINRWGMAVPGATVQIGTQQALTDDNGVFSIDNVSATYDASLLVGQAGWVYQGLTRRNPTLQVYDSLDDREAFIDVGFKNGKLGTNEHINVAFGTPTGCSEEEDVGTDDTFPFGPEWQGAATTSSTGHALYWTENAVTKLPVSYKGYDSQPLPLSVNDQNTMITFDLAAKVIASKAVTGSATPFGQGNRHNRIFMRFTSGASITLVDDLPSKDAFSYVIPQLSDGVGATLAAWEGELDGPLGMIHRDGLKPGDATGALDIPAPPTILTPPYDTKGVDDKTSFSFKASADNAGTFLVIVHRLTPEFQKLYVVTTQKKLTLPDVVEGALALTTGAEYEWWVETHGSFATVDQMTGPNGFVDEFSKAYTSPVGTKPADGTYTYTAAYHFTAQ